MDDTLAQAVLNYIEVSLMSDIRIAPMSRLLMEPAQDRVNQALRDAGYGGELDKILANPGRRHRDR
jgi:hypothetical protein